MWTFDTVMNYLREGFSVKYIIHLSKNNLSTEQW